jgi:phosphosulfolactate phosphohydrolase-like enzyme
MSQQLTDLELNDAAEASALIDRRFQDQLLRLFEASEHGRALLEAGFGDDLKACAAIDSFPVLPLYQDRQITKLGPDRER